MTLPAEAYTEGEQFQREKRTIFAHEFLPFCADAQLAEPGAFILHTIGGWPIFVIRDADGVLRGFRNVCRHQRMPVVDKPEGRCHELRCRFHGWTYGLDGGFLGAPPMMAPKDPAAEQHRLERVALDERAGLVFTRLDPTAGGAAPALDLAAAPFVQAIAAEAACNWKAFVEHLLPDKEWRYLWPLGFVREMGPGHIVRQIIPRSFLRTRIVDLLFGMASTIAETVQPDITTVEALQARLAAGEIAAPRGAVAEFHDQVATACAL